MLHKSLFKEMFMSVSALLCDSGPVCLPQTKEAKFFRLMEVSPDESQHLLEYVAQQYRKAFKRRIEWYVVPHMIRWAKGEVSDENPNLGIHKKKPAFRRLSHAQMCR